MYIEYLYVYQLTYIYVCVYKTFKKPHVWNIYKWMHYGNSNLWIINMMVSFKIITEAGSRATHCPKGFIHIILLSRLWGQYC